MKMNGAVGSLSTASLGQQYCSRSTSSSAGDTIVVVFCALSVSTSLTCSLLVLIRAPKGTQCPWSLCLMCLTGCGLGRFPTPT